MSPSRASRGSWVTVSYHSCGGSVARRVWSRTELFFHGTEQNDCLQELAKEIRRDRNSLPGVRDRPVLLDGDEAQMGFETALVWLKVGVDLPAGRKREAVHQKHTVLVNTWFQILS